MQKHLSLICAYFLVLLLFLGVMQRQFFVEYLLVSLSEYPGFRACIGHSPSTCVLEVVDEGLLPLETCISYLTDFDAHEIGPFLVVEFLLEIVELGGTCHVDEGIAHVAAITCVHWKVEEILAPQKVSIDKIQQHGLCVLVWDVFDHKGCALVGRVTHLIALHILEVSLMLLFQWSQFLLRRARGFPLILGGHDDGGVLTRHSIRAVAGTHLR